MEAHGLDYSIEHPDGCDCCDKDFREGFAMILSLRDEAVYVRNFGGLRANRGGIYWTGEEWKFGD